MEKYKEMQVIITCFTVILLCSCRHTINSLPSGTSKETKRHDEIRRIMRESYIYDIERNAYWLTTEERNELRRMRKNFNADISDSDSIIALMTPVSGWEIRGPLSIDRFKAEMMEMYEESLEARNEVYDNNKSFEDSEISKDIARFERQYQEGDEIYFFRSSERSWVFLCGSEGYIFIRKNQIMDKIVTAIN